MAKQIKELDVAAEYTEWAVEYTLDGELCGFEADDENDARLIQAAVGGKLLVRKVFETTWADAPND